MGYAAQYQAHNPSAVILDMQRMYDNLDSAHLHRIKNEKVIIVSIHVPQQAHFTHMKRHKWCLGRCIVNVILSNDLYLLKLTTASCNLHREYGVFLTHYIAAAY